MNALLVIVVLVGLLVLAGVVGGAVLLARSSRQTAQRDAVIPGIDVQVPTEWALGHDPEARLHRRIAAVVSSLDATIGQAGVDAIATRAQLMLDATALDQRLVAIWSLPRETKPAALADAEQSVGALESAAAATVLAPGLDASPLSPPPTLPPLPDTGTIPDAGEKPARPAREPNPGAQAD